MHKCAVFLIWWPCLNLKPTLINIYSIFLLTQSMSKSLAALLIHFISVQSDLISIVLIRVGLRLRHGHQIKITVYLCIYKQLKVGLIKIQHS